MINEQLQMQAHALGINSKFSLAEQLNSILSDRPLEVAKRVNATFKDISNDSMSRFVYNGTSQNGYDICEISTKEFVASKLKDCSSRGITSFSFVDVGAGRHGCATHITDYINNNRHLFPNIKHVEIVSLSGDNSDSTQEDIGICRVSKVAGFKIEEIERWINPSDELIKTYEILSDLAKDCNQTKGALNEISSFIQSNNPLYISKAIDDEAIDLDDFKKQNVSFDKDKMDEIAHELKDLISNYNILAKRFKEKHKIELSLDLNQIKKDIGFIHVDLIEGVTETIKNLSSQIARANIAESLSVDAKHDLERLKTLKEFNLPKQYDYATSSFCLSHLLDPVGTFKQLHDILTPGTGILHADGFVFNVKDKSTHIEANNNISLNPMLELLHNSKVPYVMDHKNLYSSRLCGFIISRTNSEKMNLNFKYTGFTQLIHRRDYDNDCQSVITIDTNKTWVTAKEINERGYFRDSGYESDKVHILERGIKSNRYGQLKSLFFISAETSLLIEKLHYEGINPGLEKLTTKDLSAISLLNYHEYPQEKCEKSPDISLIRQNYLYNDIILPEDTDIENHIILHPELINHHALMLSIKRGENAINYELLLNHLREKNDNIDGLIIDSFAVAIKKDARKIIDHLLSDKYDLEPVALYYIIEHALAEKRDDLALRIAKTYSHKLDEINNLAIEYGNKTGRENYAVQEFISNNFKKKLNEQQLGLIFSQIPNFDEKILDDCQISKNDICAVGKISKIKILLSPDAIEAYKAKFIKFEDLAKIEDNYRIQKLTSSEARNCYQHYGAKFEYLAEIQDNNRVERLISSNIQEAYSKYHMKLDELAEVIVTDEDKLQYLFCERAKSLYVSKTISFRDLAKNNIDKLEALFSHYTNDLYNNAHTNEQKGGNIYYAASFEQLSKIDDVKKLEILVSKKVKDLCEEHSIPFAQLIEFDEKKLNLLISPNVKAMCEQDKQLFSELIKLDIKQIKEKILENKLIQVGAIKKDEDTPIISTSVNNDKKNFNIPLTSPLGLTEVQKIKHKLNQTITREADVKTSKANNEKGAEKKSQIKENKTNNRNR